MSLLKLNAKARFRIIRTILAVCGLALMALSLMGPQVLSGYTEVSRNGLDIYVLIDTSNSMLTEDIEPDRISRAKNIIGDIIDNLHGDRIGFIPFSSDAYIQMPLTDDYRLAHMFLDVIDTDMIAGGGTDIGAAVKLANTSFDRTSSADRVIIILSDGEEHGQKSIETLKKIEDDHLKVYTIGVGTEEGGLIPVYRADGQQRIDYKKDSTGNFVTSRLNPDTLKEMAVIGKGSYYQSSLSGDELSLLIKDIAALQRDSSMTKKMRQYNQLYQYFLGSGLLLFLAACLLPERRKNE